MQNTKFPHFSLVSPWGKCQGVHRAALACSDTSPQCVLSLLVWKQDTENNVILFITPVLSDCRIKWISKQPEFVPTALQASWSINLGTSMSVVVFHHKVSPAWLGIALKSFMRALLQSILWLHKHTCQPREEAEMTAWAWEKLWFGKGAHSCFFWWQCQVKLCDSLCGLSLPQFPICEPQSAAL